MDVIVFEGDTNKEIEAKLYDWKLKMKNRYHQNVAIHNIYVSGDLQDGFEWVVSYNTSMQLLDVNEYYDIPRC